MESNKVKISSSMVTRAFAGKFYLVGGSFKVVKDHEMDIKL